MRLHVLKVIKYHDLATVVLVIPTISEFKSLMTSSPSALATGGTPLNLVMLAAFSLAHSLVLYGLCILWSGKESLLASGGAVHPAAAPSQQGVAAYEKLTSELQHAWP